MKYCEKCKKEITGTSTLCDECKNQPNLNIPEKTHRPITLLLLLLLIIIVVCVGCFSLSKTNQKYEKKYNDLTDKIESMETQNRSLRSQFNQQYWKNQVWNN